MATSCASSSAPFIKSVGTLILSRIEIEDQLRREPEISSSLGPYLKVRRQLAIGKVIGLIT